MNDHERLSRYAKSMELYGLSITLSIIATICGLIGIAIWPLLMVAVGLLVASWIALVQADRISPYK